LIGAEDYMDKANIQPPVIVDLGSKRKKDIKDLKNGRGKLLVEVELAVEQARATLPESDRNKAIIPVVVLYRKKGRKRGYGSLPFSPLNPFSLLRC
jgi:uncharacterized protein DUF6200